MLLSVWVWADLTTAPSGFKRRPLYVPAALTTAVGGRWQRRLSALEFAKIGRK